LLALTRHQPSFSTGARDLMNDPQAQPAAAAVVGTTGLPSNVAGALSYLAGPITGILFLVLEKKDAFVRFHAAQCIGLTVAGVVLSIGLMILGAILSVVPILGWLLGILLSLGFSLAAFGLWLFLMFQAWQGRSWEVPVVGRKAREILLGGSHGG
jgi:uncharacterized membrane protein